MSAIRTRRLSDALGVEITGLDVSKPLDDATFREVVETWHQGLVAVFPGQDLSTEQQGAFAKCFGELELVRTKPEDPGKQTVMFVSNRTVDGIKGVLPTGEMQFHADQCYYEVPCMATFLYGIQIPKEGGNTLFANAYRAYERLPQDVKERLVGRTALHVYDYDGSTGTIRIDKHSPDAPRFEHPVVTRHPETGRPVLFVNRLMTDHIVGMSENESAEILEQCFAAIEAEDNVYEHVWHAGDLVVWDNRCTLHARTDFNPTEARTLRRLTVRGTRPVAASA